MKYRLLLILVLGLPILLTACQGDTTLTFSNKTECGTATITLTNEETGNLEQYTLDEGKTIELKIKHSVVYNYEIQYSGRPDSNMTCETKRGVVEVPERGQNANFSLLGVTATPGSNE
ncbi:MAG: hypothetical protein JW966_06455 [Anaerolineae bacterium]|nr:hypothetical protein [Anaerolineae bacterium]